MKEISIIDICLWVMWATLVLSCNVKTNATMVFTILRRFELAITNIWLHYMNQPYRDEMVSVLDSSAVKLDSSSGRVKPDYKIGICCFSAKHAALRSKIKYGFARNQNNVSEWSDMSTRGLLFQWGSTIKISVLV